MLELLGRIIEILIFFAMIRSALSLILRIFRASRPPGGGTSPSTPPKGPAPTATESTLLHQDPVCGTYVAAGTSYRKICKGQVYHFCSEACRDKFAA